MHRLDFSLYFHPKDFWGNGVRTHVNSREKSPLKEKFSSEEDRTHDAASSRAASPTCFSFSSSSSVIDSRAGQIFSPVDATKPAVR